MPRCVLPAATVLALCLLAACREQPAGHAPAATDAPTPAAPAPAAPADTVPIAAMEDQAASPAQRAWKRCRMETEHQYVQAGYHESGMQGFEDSVAERCGPYPYDALLTDIVAQPPTAVVQSPPWKYPFRELLGEQYPSFVDGLQTASPTRSEGDWVVGSGVNTLAPDTARSAFAINLKTRQVLAAQYGDTFATYGFSIGDDGQVEPDGLPMPPAFRQWLQDTVYANAN